MNNNKPFISYIYNSFPKIKQSTIGTEFFTKNFTLENGQKISLQFWDTCIIFF